MFKKFTAENGKIKIANKTASAKRGYFIATVAIVLAVLILLNVGMYVLGDRLHLSWDLSENGDFTLSEQNREYIEDVNKPVTITVCANKEDYTGSYYSEYVAYYHSAEDSTGKYFTQTARILEEYANYNRNIKLNFIDIQQNEFTAIRQAYPSENFNYGDILVESSFKGSDGSDINRHKVLTFEDIYTVSDESGMAAYGYGSYTVSGNNLETKLSSAIYYVTSEKTVKAKYFKAHSSAEILEANLIPTLELNNYECSAIEDAVITKDSFGEDTDLLIMGCVMSDFKTEELEAINTFLENGQERGKGLVFYASTSSPKLPNLYGFLEEWGISVGEGILFETTENYTTQVQTNMLVMNENTDYTAEVNSKSGLYLANNMVPLSSSFERYQNREVKDIMNTSDTVVLAPSGIDPNTFKPDATYAKKSYPAALLCTDTSYELDADGKKSYVIVFASTDFAYSEYIGNSNVLNMDMSLCAANLASGNSASPISFTAKTITNENFSESVNLSGVKIMRAVFVIIIPLGVIAVCLFVYFRRKRR